MDITNSVCKGCDHLEGKELYTCLTCKGGSHFESLEEEITELKGSKNEPTKQNPAFIRKEIKHGTKTEY